VRAIPWQFLFSEVRPRRPRRGSEEDVLMMRHCAWCGRGLGRAEPLEDASPTHGICRECSLRMLEDAGICPLPLPLTGSEPQQEVCQEEAQALGNGPGGYA
jgi:hypothetical protein